MEEQLISFETAKLAKKKGFNIPVDRFYNESLQGLGWRDSNEDQSKRNFNNSNTDYSAPTQSLLQKWLRIKHQIDITVMIRFADSYGVVIHKDRNIYDGFEEIIIHPQYQKDTYAEALEIGLLEALKLI